jgi:hypothetical protein
MNAEIELQIEENKVYCRQQEKELMEVGIVALPV